MAITRHCGGTELASWSSVIRVFIFIVVGAASFAAGYYLPPRRDATPPVPTIPEVPSVPPPTAATVRSVHASGPTASEQTPPVSKEREQKRLNDLEKLYVVTNDTEERSTIIDTISDLETPAIVPVIGRLFAIETDAELKESLIDAVGWSEVTDSEKAAIYSSALGTGQPANVRMAAIEGLAELDSKEALPLVRPLAEDADMEVRKAALETIRGFENP